MKVLITGGAGFIGSHIVEEVLKKGWEPIIVDNLSTGNINNIPENTPFYKMDIRSTSLNRVFEEHRPTVVIHQAAQVSVDYSRKHPEIDCDINLIGTINVLNLCVQYHVSKIIFASSAAVYGETKSFPIHEETVERPISYYGLSKYSAEQYIKLYSRTYGLSYTILRYSNVFGMRQNQFGEAGVISIFVNQMINNQSLRVYGDGNQTRDFIFVKDISKANVQAVILGDNETINISTNKQVSINHLIDEIQSSSSNQLQVQYVPARIGDIENSSLSNKKAQSILKWSPETTFRQGIQETIKYYQDCETFYLHNVNGYYEETIN